VCACASVQHVGGAHMLQIDRMFAHVRVFSTLAVHTCYRSTACLHTCECSARWRCTHATDRLHVCTRASVQHVGGAHMLQIDRMFAHVRVFSMLAVHTCYRSTACLHTCECSARWRCTHATDRPHVCTRASVQHVGGAHMLQIDCMFARVRVFSTLAVHTCYRSTACLHTCECSAR
jgi:hypothetical protein